MTSILVVEDELLIGVDIKARLKAMGYDVVGVVNTSEKAMKSLEQQRPDLVLMDIVLKSRVDGIDTANQIRELYGIPVVYLTSHADQQTLKRVKESQPSGYIVKPFVDEALYAVIETALYKNQMEARLKEREAWLSTVLASIGDGVIATDNNRVITFVNTVAELLTGVTSSKAVGQRLDHAIQVHYGEEYYQMQLVMNKVLAGDSFIPEADTYLIAPDGQKISLEMNCAPIRTAEGKVDGAVLVFRDITLRKKAEEALRQERGLLTQRVKERTEKLSLANAELTRTARLKDEFFANMSHEFRTPLNAILGLSEALQDEVYGSLTDKQSESLKVIEKSGNHLLSLINDILDISKIEAGKLKIEKSMVDIASLLEASFTMVKAEAQKKSITFKSRIQEGVLTVFADERRMIQVLVNLLSNAIKFTPVKGRVSLEVRLDETSRAVKFSVRDTGIGISEKDMYFLFQPFSQLDSKLSRVHSGTGLGLVLVRRLMELHGGGVSLESTPKKGSCFSVSLPLEEPSAPKEKVSRKSRKFLKSKWPNGFAILIVEDQKNDRFPLREYLENKGNEVFLAREFQEAIQLINEFCPDVMIMDAQISGFGDPKTIAKLRQQELWDTVQILILNGLDLPGDRERWLKSGANGYFTKPVAPENLYHHIITIKKE